MPRLQSLTAVVTGSSSGIGRAIALRFAHEGARIICSDLVPTSRTPTESIPTHTLITQRGGSAIFVACDVSDESQVDKLVAEAVGWGGRLDIMVNNAGICAEQSGPVFAQPIWSTPTEYLEKSFAVNVRGVFLGIKYAARQMVAQAEAGADAGGSVAEGKGSANNAGCIINLASVFGHVGVVQNASYVASKHAVMGLTRSASLDCAKVGIRVNALCPGFTHTALISQTMAENTDFEKHFGSLHPLGGFGEPEKLVGAAVFLASEDAVWVTGTGLTVDGGYLAQ